MINNTSLIELAGHYLGLLKNEMYTFEEFEIQINVLMDTINYDSDRDKYKVRDALIIIKQVGEKWK